MKKFLYFILFAVTLSSCYVAARHLKWTSPHIDACVDTLTSIIGRK